MGEKEPLAQVAAERLKCGQLRLCLDTFGKHFDAEAVTHGDDRGHDGQVICILREPVDERAVDLQLGYGEPLQAAKGAVGRAREAASERQC